MATDKPMQLGMVGLGRMGANLVRRLMRDGHHCVVYDISADAVKELEGEGAKGSTDLATFVNMLETPRNIWLMIPAGIVEQTLDQLKPLVAAGDTIVDGGNSYYRDDILRSKGLKPEGSAATTSRWSGWTRSGSPSPRARAWCRPPRAWTTARARPTRVTCTAGRPGPGTSSRWSTTASSTA
jgi:6-phosphogluconate dehydrogenase